MVADAATALAPQVRALRPDVPVTVVVLPVVGFGDQSARALPRTLRLLRAQRDHDRAILVVAVVNRPTGRAPDATLRLIAGGGDWSDAPPGSPTLAVCDVPLTLRPRIGEVRQLALDAVAAAGVALDGSVVVLMDDDLVVAPADLLSGLADRLDDGGADLTVGPVLFDDPDVPMCLFPELYLSDLVRALIADRLVAALGGSGLARPSAGPWPAPDAPHPDVFESLVLTGDLAVRASTLRQVGGLRDLNEMTWLLRDVVAGGRPVRAASEAGARCLPEPHHLGLTPTVSGLVHRSVRMSSRRALAAWTDRQRPTVAQWQACRLRSRHVDPVRLRSANGALPPPVCEASRATRRALLDGLAPAIATTLTHLEPSPELASWALEQIGLDTRWVRIDPPAAPGAPWDVRLSRAGAVFDVLDVLQRCELAARRHEGAAWGLLPAATAVERTGT